jgi:hypothetical protein
MRVKFFIDNSANINSTKSSAEIDVEGWEYFTEDQKQALAQEWADQHILVWYEENK